MLSFSLSVTCSTILSVCVFVYLDSKIEKVTQSLTNFEHSERVLQKRSVEDDLHAMNVVGQKAGIAVRLHSIINIRAVNNNF